ncbi:hypothetical protein C1S80_06470 [Mycolicibacterium aubagnense]|nr:hypothetical protein C1S80_06470 [Mycolicibacterium aubagnense]
MARRRVPGGRWPQPHVGTAQRCGGAVREHRCRRRRPHRGVGPLMSEFSVNPAALAAVIDRMTAFDSDLEAHLTQAAGSVARLGSSWYGDAGEAERSAQAQWDEGAREMREALARLRQIAEGAHENYSTAASKNHQMWS